MIPSVVKEASGLYTMTSTLFMQPVKADAKSVFHCTVEYSMPNNQIKQESSDKFNLSLLCESDVHTLTMCQLYAHLPQTPHPALSSNQIQQKLCSSNWRIRGQSKRGMMCWWSVRLMETLSPSLNFIKRWETIHAKSQSNDLADDIILTHVFTYSLIRTKNWMDWKER